MIAGIVLAAGRSRRMGSPKALLTVRGRTFLEVAVDALRRGGCEPVVVVAPSTDTPAGDRIASETARLGAVLVVNPDPGSEQVDSLRTGLRTLGGAVRAAVVLPVDVPGANWQVVARVVDAFRSTDAPAVAPAHGGRRGHPVLFSRAVFGELLHGDLPEGARTVLHAHAAALVEVPVDSLPTDVDTPDDYRRAIPEP
jgi:CTP:molybdopterin cytidylyltransferase MocA